MAKKTVGYVRLEWTCPRCGSRNPGPKKSCAGCGAPQPHDVSFHQAAEEELIKEDKEIERAAKGPDVHCPYCGARNPSDAKTCSQCSGDLTEAQARQAGAVVGAHVEGPAPEVACKACGAMNPASAERCAKCGSPIGEVKPAAPEAAPAGPGCSPVYIAIGAVVLGIIALILFLSLKTNDVIGTVKGASWTRSVAVEAFGDVQHEDWLDEIPTDALMGQCTQKVHHTQETPAEGAREICGTAYTKDTGSGYGEVVQDCEYEVLADWCSYTVKEWRVIDWVTQSGADMNPQWPVPSLQAEQRAGERKENFEIQFDADGKTYSLTTGNLDDFEQYRPGTRWILKINQLGGLNSVEPAD